MGQVGQAELLQAARRGDQAALGELLQQFRPYVRVLTEAAWRGQAPARQDDSDLMQDTMLTAHQAFARFRGETIAEFAGWLRTLALRTVGLARRAQVATGKRSISREQLLAELDQIASPADAGPDEQASRHEQAARVAAALEKLPDDMQQVLHGRSSEGLSYAELAVQMRRTEGALRVLYTRALRRLADELGDRPS